MLRSERNRIELGGWAIEPIDQEDHRGICSTFDCGDEDLNEYFNEQALLNKAALIGQPYFFYDLSDEDKTPIALIDLCNDAVRRDSSNRQPGYKGVADVEDGKQYPFLPAVKISRFGVAKELRGNHIGSHVLNMVKQLFVTENRTGCRFLTVDAYNNERTINFYVKNEFKPFYDKDERKETRTLFYDLKRLIL